MKKRTLTHLGIPLSGLLFVAIALTGGCSTVSTKSSVRLTSTPVKTEDPKLQEELKQLDAFLDANIDKALETELRHDIERWDDSDFQEKFPQWKQLTLDQPALPEALISEKLFLLHRSLARMTGNLPLEARHLQRLDDFLEANPSIQDALEDDPSLITSIDFLGKNPSLAAFFDKHPDLFTIFVENPGTKSAL